MSEETKQNETKAPKAKLVVMTLGEESIEVHPTCVEAHEAAGWKQAE